MGGYKLGKILGFPIEIRTSFLVLLGLVTLSGLVNGHPLLSVALLITTFVSVLLHELGHAVVARRLGVPIVGIDLNLFGGAAKMLGMPKNARDEISIAAAGPAVSLALALVAGLLHALTGFFGFFYLMWTNLLLGLFNLLPALPMDGGRIFRAVMSKKMGHQRATALAVKVARGVAIGIGVFGLVSANFWLVALAVMLWMMAGAELQAAQYIGYGFGTTPGPGPYGYGPFGAASNPSRGSASRGLAGSAAGAAAGAGFFSRLFGGGRSDRGAGDVEVLGRDGRPVDQAGVEHRGAAFMIEERVENGVRRWIVRDAAGNVLLRSEYPLN